MEARKRPNRKTVDVQVQVAPEFVAQLRLDTERARYRTQRAYLEALIAQGLVPEAEPRANAPVGQTESLEGAFPSAASAIEPTILANRVVLALEALTERVRAGEDVEALRVDLMSVRHEIVQHLVALRADYDREVAARDRRHYARFGTVDE